MRPPRGQAPWGQADVVCILYILGVILMHILDVIVMHIFDVLIRMHILDVLLLLLATTAVVTTKLKHTYGKYILTSTSSRGRAGHGVEDARWRGGDVRLASDAGGGATEDVCHCVS